MTKTRPPPRLDARGRGTDAVVTLSWTYASGHHVPAHFHAEDQLVYAETGVMTVHAAEASWVVPAKRAVWVPARVEHAIEIAGEVAMKSLYLAPRLVKALPRACRVLGVSPLLRELILRTCSIGRLRRSLPNESHLLALIRDELAASPFMPMELPLIRDARAKLVADVLLADPGDRRTLDELCVRSGASKRTLERTFVRETGMTFGKWRQQLSLVHGMRLVAMGAKVTSAALDAGYDSPSAFIAMFRRAVGSTPARWLEESTKRLPGA